MKSRKKCALSIVFVLLLCVFCQLNYSACEKNVTNDYKYIIENNEITITGYTGSNRKIVIPNEIEGLPVSKIGDEAFMDYSFNTVSLPDGLYEIGERAFKGCKHLKTINFPDSIRSIDKEAFYGCVKMNEVTFNEDIRTIGESSFCNCFSLRTVEIPSAVSFIGETAFANCKKLESIEVDSDNRAFCSIDGVLYSKDCKYLIQYPCVKKDLKYEILDSVEYILYSAFAFNPYIVEIEYPNHLQLIGPFAFWQCSSLASAFLPDSVAYIGAYAYGGCTSLVEAYVPGGAVTIPMGMFASCDKLEDVEISEGLINIYDMAFHGCDSLHNFDIPESVENIADTAFPEGWSGNRHG